MNLVKILFYFFILMAGTGAIAILFSRNVFKSALYLLTSLLSVAALYVLSFAEFLAVTQILIYAGGILVIIIFGIMLTTRITGRSLVVEHTHLFGGAVAGIAFFVLLVRYLPASFQQAPPSLAPENIETIALKIFSRFSLPFEVAGLLLLIALIGAAVIASHLKTKV